MKNVLRTIVFGVIRFLKGIYWKVINIGYSLNLLSVRDIPIVINNFNRVSSLRLLIEFLERCRFTNIIILDNQSTYPPLLDFYRDLKHEVIRLPKNYGHLAFWKSGLYDKFKWNYFVYTDPDVLPITECPLDFLNYFKSILDNNYQLDKIGFGIRIDDLPDHFAVKEKVIAYEKRYWDKQVSEGLYDAPVDTTFALYKPLSDLKADEVYTLKAYRTGAPYLLHHLPWYVDSKNLSNEEMYYLKSSNSSSSIAKQQSEDQKVY